MENKDQRQYPPQKSKVGRKATPETEINRLHHSRLLKIEMDEARKLIDEQIKLRFLEEIERLEADGRVQSRAKLERDLLMYYNKITQMKYGNAQLQPSAVALLKRLYNGDDRYVLIGVRDFDHSGPRMGAKRLDIYTPYTYHYKTWKRKTTPDPDATSAAETSE